MIIDSDVLIWYSREHPKAVELIHSLESFSISAVTYMEIVQGVRNKSELNAFKGIVNLRYLLIFHRV